jgi:membrane protein DedA with SNARE-associated domain
MAILDTVKNKPAGAIIGAIGGYLIAKKIPIPFITIPSIIICAIIGSSIEYKYTEPKK